MITPITVKITPISENKIWQGGRIKTDEYRKWREQLAQLLRKKHCETILGWVAVEVDFYLHNFLATDGSNLEKGFFDALVDAKLIKDDKWIKWHRTEKWPVDTKEEQKISFKIIPLDFEHQKRAKSKRPITPKTT